MAFDDQEIFQTIRMVEMETLDVRTVTLSLNLLDCAGEDLARVCDRIYDKIARRARDLVKVCDGITEEFGVPIVNKRLAVTPISLLCDALGQEDVGKLALTLDRAAREVGVNFVGGYSALVPKGFTRGDLRLLRSLPEALAGTERVCASVAAASTRAGINMDAVLKMGGIICETARLTADRGGLGNAKLVVFCNIPDDNPFMAGAMHGIGEPDVVINTGVSGPGVVRAVIERLGGDVSLDVLAEAIKQTAFKFTRVGELVGRTAAHRLDYPFGIVDLSLAPTPAPGDSVGEILKAMGLEQPGAPGSTAALALLTDAVKKGGVMASSAVGGLSGAFIPVSEDAGMVEAVRQGALSIEKLEAMTSVCSVGLDMVALPGDTPPETVAALIADQMAIGAFNQKTTAARLLPIPGKGPGETVEFGGLLGTAIVQPVRKLSAANFVRRGGRIPAPLLSLRN